jgi:chromate transporter
MNPMLYLQLFLSFCRVGFTSFGGLSMIAVINDEMLSHGWMTATEVMDILAIAEMTPGPFCYNCSTFAGMRVAGVPGAIIALIGVWMPTLTVCVLVAYFFEKFKASRFMTEALYAIRPVCLGMIIATMFQLMGENFFVGSMVQWRSILISCIVGYFLIGRKWSILKSIVLAAALGLFLA